MAVVTGVAPFFAGLIALVRRRVLGLWPIPLRFGIRWWVINWWLPTVRLWGAVLPVWWRVISWGLISRRAVNWRLALLWRAARWSARWRVISLRRGIALTLMLSSCHFFLSVHNSLPDIGGVFLFRKSSHYSYFLNTRKKLILLPGCGQIPVVGDCILNMLLCVTLLLAVLFISYALHSSRAEALLGTI